MSKLRRLLDSPFMPPIVSGLMLQLAFAPFNLGLIVFVALVPWLVSLSRRSMWGAARSGALFGVVFILGQMSWLPLFVNRWTDSSVLGVVAWLATIPPAAILFAFLGWTIALAYRHRMLWLIPLIWAGFEVIRSYLPLLAFPWGIVANPLWPYAPLIQKAHFGSIYLVSAWVVLMNVLLAEFLRGAGILELRTKMIAFMFLLMTSLIQFSVEPTGERRSFTIGQLGVDMAFGHPLERQLNLYERTQLMLDSAARSPTEFLLLPEGLIEAGDRFPPFLPFQIPDNVNVIFGGRRGDEIAYQSAFAFDGEWSFADKTRLVIFGEYVPGRQWLPFLDSFNVAGSDLHPGERADALQVGDLTVGPLICFEALFFDLAHKQARNGAQILAIMSIDDWYFETQAPHQLMSYTVWRAVETGLPAIRSATLGYSMAVDSKGRMVAMAPLRETVPLQVQLLVPERGSAFPGRLIFPWLAAASLPLTLAYGLWRSRRPAG